MDTRVSIRFINMPCGKMKLNELKIFYLCYANLMKVAWRFKKCPLSELMWTRKGLMISNTQLGAAYRGHNYPSI